MRKLLVILLPVIVLAVVAAGGWYWWTEWRHLQSTDDAYVQSDISLISPKIEGYIKEVRAKDNQPVAAGGVLFVIDDRDLAAKLVQAEAAVATAEAAVDTYESRLELQRAMIDQTKAEVTAAEAEKARTERDYQRYKQLAASDYASRQRLETVQADDEKAAAALAQKRAAVVAALGTLRVLRAQRDEEKAKREQARAAVQLARNDLDQTVIRAPVAGIAGNRAGQVGQYVKPGTQLLSLVPLTRVYITANFKETQLTRMRVGQAADIFVDAYPELPLTGRIESFAPASGAQFSLLPPDNATGNFTKIVQRVPVRIAVPADAAIAGLLRPGLSVTVTVDTRGKGESHAGDGLVGAAQAQPAAPSEPNPGR
jgi:membrane fusion protein (multidrug efflux system)